MTWSEDHPAIFRRHLAPQATNRAGSPSVLESLQSTPRFLAQGIATESSREESNRSPAMNPIKSSMRRRVTTLMLVVALIGGGVFGL